MLSRRAGDAIEFSADGQGVLFALDARRFADITHACAVGDNVIVTAAESPADVADVSSNRRGNYRAWRVGARGERCLTREYTNTAIALPDGGGEAIAYSNGSNLVLLEGGSRRAFKSGAFSWGPVSLSVDRAGRRVAMTKWQGDKRKLFWVERVPGATGLSAFSYYDYLLREDDCCICTASALKRYTFADASLTTITDTKLQKRLVDALGLDDIEFAQMHWRWGHLAQLDGRLVSALQVCYGDAWEVRADALVALGSDGTIELLQRDIAPWGVSALSSDGRSLHARLERYENATLVEVKTCSFGGHAAALNSGWQLVSGPHQPDPGFQFLPG
jgi:hypothetical protein